ncbi:MAG: PhoH family protein [Candidatus Eisenbacteria bacterium]|uniref:PhoH family protein n=1 Tax=Eiseniibacteriota bacterium TaxID=2212470 RepID=A0A956RPT4_UNCEI|nr:PhoH family protein [Candidatus Eisenbacteria bacterium]
MDGTLDGFDLGALAGRCYLLDTNVLLHDATALLAFDEHNIILTIDILEELDRFKRGNDERGRNARYVIRTIDELRGKGSLPQGVALPGGGKLFVMVDDYVDHLPRGMDGNIPDNRILATGLFLEKNGVNIIFVSKDINARVKGEILGLQAEDLQRSRIDFDELYTGWAEIDCTGQDIDLFYQNKAIKLDGPFYPNQGVLLRNESNGKQTALGIYRADTGQIESLKHYEARPWGIQALNLQQHFALELLLRPDIELVTMLGQAGTGKTLLALAAGLHQVAEKKLYRRIMVSRPVIPLGRDIGYLPGTKEEKLESWMEPVQDNLKFLVDPQLEQTSEKVDYLFATGMIEIEAVTYIRGRSLPGLFILIDEAQNLTPHEVKTAVSRAGKDTKVVLTGDAYQIDNPYLDASSNGLTYVVERFKGQSIYGHITLNKSERSRLASLAAELL